MWWSSVLVAAYINVCWGMWDMAMMDRQIDRYDFFCNFKYFPKLNLNLCKLHVFWMESYCSRLHNVNRQHRQNRRPLSCVSRWKRSTEEKRFTKTKKWNRNVKEVDWDVRARGAEEAIQLWAIWENISGCNFKCLACFFSIQAERKEKKR